MDLSHYFYLVANDKSKIIIDNISAKKSALLMDVIQEFTNDEEVYLDISKETLQFIVEYLNHYKDVSSENIKACPKPIPNKDINFKDLVDGWSYEFVKSKSYDQNMNLVIASEYMAINPLHDLLCSYGASFVNSMETTEEIVKFFNIHQDITEEEMKTLEKEELENIKKKVAIDRELESKIFD